MRFEGKFDRWNDDRGFGFITPTPGGEPVFVHISAFPRDGSIHCLQMISCDEATFDLKNCPGTQMDGEGIPCEPQWCNGPLGW